MLKAAYIIKAQGDGTRNKKPLIARHRKEQWEVEMQEISVYDDKNNHLGMCFPRRAKTLVAKGRAAWRDERSIMLINSGDERNDSEMKTLYDEKYDPDMMKYA